MAWGWARRLWSAVTARLHVYDSAPKPIDRMFAEMSGGAGSVSRAEAVTVPAVAKARNMICSLATLPLVELSADNVQQPNPLLQQFDPDVPNVVHLSQTFEDLLFEGIAWWRVTQRRFDNFPYSVRRVDPALVSLDPPSGREVSPLPSGHDPRGAVGVWIGGVFTPAADVIRFDSPVRPLLRAGARTIRKALRYDSAASTYAENPAPLDYFSPAPGADPITDDEAREHISEWMAARRTGGVGWIPDSMIYNRVSSPSAADMQLVELGQRVALELANHTGLDPEVLGVSTTSRTYANAQDFRQDRINDVLSPFMSALTDRLSMGDVTRRGYRVQFFLSGYMRANPTERWGVYEKAVNMGVMDPEEVRAAEGWPAGAPGRPAAAAPAADTAAGDELAARRRRASGFSDEPRVVQFSAQRTGFTVDASSRTIRGLALPYGEIASKYGVKYRFAKGSVEWSDEVSRVKMLRDHDFTQALGKATGITDGDAGLDTAFKIARGPEGDRALELAEDGVLDGLSVGVEFDDAVDTVPDPDNEGVLLVRRATLREVSLTAMPAFDSARVTVVAASRTDEGATMTQPTQPAPVQQPAAPAAPAAAPGAPTLEQFHAWWQQQQTQPAAPAGPTVVNPAAPGGTALVREPAPYRFDRRGNLQPGSHDFSTDVFALMKGDAAAGARVQEFILAQFDVVTTDVNELNPTRNRPEMYVDQRDYDYPIWRAIEKGTLTDVTPFTFPKFSSASGLVANHTEGNEPSSGTFVTTSQTVTPTPVSGKMKISRETIDQGGNPQVSGLIWRQMVKAWFEALEAFAVSTLDAASPTQIDFSATPGLDNDDLDQAITSAFASLQFIRGGFSMDTAFTQIDLYKALIAATDADGRRLYPALGPANANGTVRGRWASLDVNGVEFLPAWALAATGTVAASSYLFDRAVVHGWASAPRRLDFEYEVANVYMGLWGYKAAAISDITGVREIVYDPA